jgi:hypothetical protein
MKCEFCQTYYLVKDNFLKKICPCDEEERMIPLNEWYYRVFKVELDRNEFMRG